MGWKTMRYYFAPLEGITGYVFRNAHRRLFPGIDKYFTPFISTTRNHKFTNREMRGVLPENNAGTNVVPQLLGKVPEDFVQAARVLKDLGYGEVNLNLGCPSGTVVAKGKGSGFLARPRELDHFLDEIFSHVEISVSVKTRLGIADFDEFWQILEIYNKYNVYELTIHPRVQKDFYQGAVKLDAFGRALRESRNPVCYNGDLRTESDCFALRERFPSVEAAMIGRGLVADPALAVKLLGGGSADIETLRAFHDEIYDGYTRDFGSSRSAMMRMKELWSYMIGLFEGGEDYSKRIKKTTHATEYESLINGIFHNLRLRGQ